MDKSAELLKSTLKKAGYSATKSRRYVFSLLDGNEPQSIAELVRQAEKHIDRSSVYRTIAIFEQLGIVRRLQTGWKYKIELSDQFNRHHHHLTCTNCGKIVPIKEDAALELMISAVSKQAGFLPSGHELEIRGLCSQCRQLLETVKS